MCALPAFLVELLPYIAVGILISCAANPSCRDEVSYLYSQYQQGALEFSQFIAQGIESIQRTLSKKKPSGSSGSSRPQISPAESEFWQGLEPYRQGTRRSGSGRNTRYYEWDYQHGGEIEVYDSRGNHLGTIDPRTGEPAKGPVPGRTCKNCK